MKVNQKDNLKIFPVKLLQLVSFQCSSVLRGMKLCKIVT